MEFAAWSPSHTILVIFGIFVFVGNLAVMYYRIGQNAKKIDKLGETVVHTMERLEERLDKRFVEMNKRIDDTNQQIAGVRAEMNKRIDDTNQQIADVRTEIADVRTEMNQGFSDVRTEMNQRFVQVHSEINHVRSEINHVRDELSKLNQNHIDHLTHHKER